MDRMSKRARNKHRIQFNFVLPGGEAGDLNPDVTSQFTKYASGSFYTRDTFLLQYQVMY